jgi:hypothetical protein
MWFSILGDAVAMCCRQHSGRALTAKGVRSRAISRCLQWRRSYWCATL